MNKRQAKKIKKNKYIDIIAKAKKDDILLFKYDMDKISAEELSIWVNGLQNALGNLCVFVPKDVFRLEKIPKEKVIEQLEIVINAIKDGWYD